jgi:DNA-binding transcriptional MocR family regulator
MCFVSEQTSWVQHYEVTGTRASEITASVEAAIGQGRLSPGAPLPTVRDLAAELKVNPNTAASAYRLLRDRGTIETLGRQGSRVRNRPATSPSGHDLILPPGTTQLFIGDPDVSLLPALALRRPSRPSGYGDATLDPDLRREADRLLAYEGVPTDHLTCIFGALDGIDRVLATRLRPGDAVAIEDPGWTHALDLLAAQNLKPVPVRVDDDGPNPADLDDALRGGAKAFVTTTRAQNPYGSITTAARAAELRAVLAAYPRVLTVDDDHGADLSPGPAHTLVGATDHWAYLRSASKAYGPDLRIALLASDARTADLVAGRLRHTARHVSRLIQCAWADAIADPQVALVIQRAAAAYDERRAALIDALAKHGIEAHGRTGLNVWVPVADESAALSSLLSAGYAAAPGTWFRQRSAPGLRVTVATLDPAEAGTVAAAIAAARSAALTRDRSSAI